MTRREIEQELNSLPLAEKLQVLQTLFLSLTDSWPAIEHTPGVVGAEIERALREQDMRKPGVDEVFAPYCGKVVIHEPLDMPTIT